jgi:hypothetical protein
LVARELIKHGLLSKLPHRDPAAKRGGSVTTGNACMVEIARVLWEQRKSLRRSVRLAWWPAHSTGR